MVSANATNNQGGIVANFTRGADVNFSRSVFQIADTGVLSAKLETKFDAVALYAATGNVPSP